MILPVTQIFYKNYDEDDEELSKARATTIKRQWIIDVRDVSRFGESDRNKEFLEVYFTDGYSMFIKHDFAEFLQYYLAAKEVVIPKDEQPEETQPVE